ALRSDVELSQSGVVLHFLYIHAGWCLLVIRAAGPRGAIVRSVSPAQWHLEECNTACSSRFLPYRGCETILARGAPVNKKNFVFIGLRGSEGRCPRAFGTPHSPIQSRQELLDLLAGPD